jgi:hypothetical protein
LSILFLALAELGWIEIHKPKEKQLIKSISTRVKFLHLLRKIQWFVHFFAVKSVEEIEKYTYGGVPVRDFHPIPFY